MKTTIVRRHTQSDYQLDGLHPILQRIYSLRGVKQLKELERSLAGLLPFSLLKDIHSAVDLLVQALQEQQKIVIIGDYDADGATSTALAIRALKAFGLKEIHYLVPNRFEYGYGLSPEIVRDAARLQPHLIITVDNGIANIEGVNAANQLGIKVLITDHHLAPEILPQAAAIVNPNQPGDEFPSKALPGVGVVFYLMMALRSRLREINWFAEKNIPEPNMAAFLDIVALGTIADVVPLDYNNRILVHQGMQRIRAGQCVAGIRALAEVTGRQLNKLSARDIGFTLAPRINAAGRLDDMSLGIECLVTDNPLLAKKYAAELHQLNIERREIEEGMKKEALIMVRDFFNKSASQHLPYGLCLFEETWHQGVIGILASRIKEKTHRPVIVFAAENEFLLKGSARSIEGVHVRDMLVKIDMQYPGLIKKFGGHAMAAGLSIPRERLQEFSRYFAEVIKSSIDEDILQARIMSDGELIAKDLSLEVAELIQQAGPWGQNFPAPLFDGVFQVLDQRLVGEKHLKLSLKQQDRVIDAICFFVDTNVWPQQRCKKVHIAYQLDVNEYLGNRSVQLIIEHIEPLFD